MSEHKPMTDEELDAIQGRFAAITEWPWKHLNGQVITWREGIAVASCSIDVTRDEQSANAVFIAHAPDDIARLLAEVKRLNKVSHYLAERLSPLNVTRRKYIGATLEDGYGNGLFFAREEAIQSWIDEANREVNNAE